MELYSVSNTYSAESGGFGREDVIDDFISFIWTERFIEAGEVEVILPAVHQHLKLLAPGNLLGCQGSQELMLLETRSIEDGMVKATGKTIEAYFNERFMPSEIVMAGLGGNILKGIVNFIQTHNIDGSTKNYWGVGPEYNIDGKIDGLEVADPDPNEWGTNWTETIPNGPVYNTLVTLGKKYKIGQSVIWTKIESENHKLVYTTRQGQDLTYPYNLVQFSPDFDNLADVKQLLSVAGAKNAAVIIPPQWVFELSSAAYNSLLFPYNWRMENESSEPPTIFSKRFMEVDCTDLTKDKLKGSSDTEKLENMYIIMLDRQRKALDEHKPTKIVDGEVTPETQYVYKRDYDLGDKVKIQGDFGDPINGVVTEYVRSQDETGERHYPVVSTEADVVTSVTTPTNA